jgi:transposase
VIDYETYARIRDCRDRQGLTITQIARTLGVHRKTVAKWLARSRFERPRPPPRTSILDPFKGRITRLLDTHPYSAQQIFQRLREEGYGGGITTLRVYVRRIRPPKLPVYLKLHFAPGECAPAATASLRKRTLVVGVGPAVCEQARDRQNRRNGRA